jgi:hypothetical protein
MRKHFPFLCVQWYWTKIIRCRTTKSWVKTFRVLVICKTQGETGTFSSRGFWKATDFIGCCMSEHSFSLCCSIDQPEHERVGFSQYLSHDCSFLTSCRGSGTRACKSKEAPRTYLMLLVFISRLKQQVQENMKIVVLICSTDVWNNTFRSISHLSWVRSDTSQNWSQLNSWETLKKTNESLWLILAHEQRITSRSSIFKRLKIEKHWFHSPVDK